MQKLWPVLAVLIGGFFTAARAADQIQIAVMEFSSKGGVSQNQMDALEDLLANEIRTLGSFQVIGKADIRAALNLNEQQNLLGCTESSCIAEIGGALGVRWVMLGNVSLFGNTWLLNLKLMDVKKMKVAASYSKSVRGTQDRLIDLLPVAVTNLFSKARKKIFADLHPKDRPLLKSPEPKPPITDTQPKIVEEKKPPRTAKELVENEWFSSPKDSGFYIGLNLGLSLLGKLQVEHDFQCSDQPSLPDECYDLQDVKEIAEGQSRSGPMLAFSLGYTFARWFSAYGQFSAAFTSGDTLSGDNRMARDFSLALGLKTAWPTGTWIEPLAYLEFGLSWYRDQDDSKTSTANQSEIAAAGPMLNFGLGADIYFNPHWFSGFRVGMIMRRWGDDKNIRILNGGDKVGFQILWANGWLF